MRLKSIIILFTLFILLGMEMPVFGQLEFIAHRGASYLAPENSLASIQLAWDLDSDGVECDIMLTKDKKIVLFHDATMQRLLGLPGRIADTAYDKIKGIPVKLADTNLRKYQGETVPLLSEALAIIPEGKTLVIEIKVGDEIIPFLKKEITDHWKSGKIAFIAFDYNTILEAKRIFPDVPCYYLSSNLEDLYQHMGSIITSNLDGVDLNHKIITKDIVWRFKREGKEVWCWTVNDPKDAKRMQEIGVSYITTDRPDWLKKELKH